MVRLEGEDTSSKLEEKWHQLSLETERAVFPREYHAIL